MSAPSPTGPLVSIIIPTHKRPDYLLLALQSAVAQTYRNLEIIISDNSGDDATRDAIAGLMAEDPRISYWVQQGGGAWENWMNAYSRAQGAYIAFLMDDDLFHPSKVARMSHFLNTYPSVSLVTSFRQLIDDQGREMAPLPGTTRLFEEDTVLEGNAMAEHILKRGMNLIGEPTTAMFRRADIGDGFGSFCGRPFAVMSDLATWMSLLHKRHCVYLPEALSYFRIHGSQDQRKKSTAINSNMEWLFLLVEGHARGMYMTEVKEYRALLAAKMQVLLPYLVAQHDELREGGYDIDAMQELLKRATDSLWR